jgi:hypothetical protein
MGMPNREWWREQQQQTTTTQGAAEGAEGIGIESAMGIVDQKITFAAQSGERLLILQSCYFDIVGISDPKITVALKMVQGGGCVGRRPGRLAGEDHQRPVPALNPIGMKLIDKRDK